MVEIESRFFRAIVPLAHKKIRPTLPKASFSSVFAIRGRNEARELFLIPVVLSPEIARRAVMVAGRRFSLSPGFLGDWGKKFSREIPLHYNFHRTRLLWKAENFTVHY